MNSDYVIDTARFCRRISNERSKQQRMLKIGKEIPQDEIDMAEKWEEKYGQYVRDKTVPPSTAWFDPTLVDPNLFSAFPLK
jgi:hypothetical protein